MAYRQLIGDVKTYYLKLFSTGWLDEWSDEEVQMLSKAIEEMFDIQPEYAVFTLSEYSLDPEGICTPDAYTNLLSDMFTAFGMKLTPNDITAETVGERITLTVSTPDGDVVWDFVQSDDWLHDDFLDFVNDELLPMWDQERIFHPLPPASTMVELVFHYPDIIEKAEEEGVIPAYDYFVE